MMQNLDCKSIFQQTMGAVTLFALLGMIWYFDVNEKDDIVSDLVIAFIATFSLIMQFFYTKKENISIE